MLRRRDPLADPEALIHRVYSYAAYRVGPGPDAEDVTSETFVRALSYRQSYNPKVGTPQSWVLGIARRVADDHLGRQRETSIGESDGAFENAQDELTESTAAKVSLHSAMKRLPDAERELLALRYGADMTAREIARVLGLKTNAVEVALHRTLAKLRSQMGAGASAR